MSHKSRVLCVGSATLDNFIILDQPLSTIHLGDKVLVKALEKHSGGGATNSAVALAKMGLKVSILTKLGHDHDAEFILHELDHYHIPNLCLHHSQKSTDFSTILTSTQDKDRIILVHKGASQDLGPQDYLKSKLRTDWIYLATLMGKSFMVARDLAHYAQGKKIPLLFNPSLYLAEKGKRYLHPILERTTILVLNKEEAQAILGTKLDSVPKLLLGLQQLGPKIVIITDGPRLLSALYQNKVYTLLPQKVKVKDTAGAGDAFTSAFLAGLIKKYPFTDCLRLGQVNSASVIRFLGCKNKLLTEREALAEIKKYQIKVEVHEAG